MYKRGNSLSLVWMLSALIGAESIAYSCGLNWSLPLNRFDGVNEKGVVSYWEQVDVADFGNGLKLPLIINFRSDRASSSPYLGGGWSLALLESHVYQLNERNFVVVQPDGETRYFYRSGMAGNILKDRGGWAAEIKDDTITAWAECGWKLTFVKGKLTTIQTPENRKLDFIHREGRVVEVVEAGRPQIKAVINPSSGQIDGLEFNGRTITFQKEDRPIVQNIGGQNLVGGVTPSLHKLGGVTNNSREYIFAVDDKIRPTLKITGQPDRIFTWNPANHLIVSDTGWNYVVEAPRDIFSKASIQRTNTKGGKEAWYYDYLRGVETSLDLNGIKTVTTYFASGILRGKLRRVEQIANGQTKVLRELSYDEKGTLLREADADGAITQFKYDNKGRLVDILRNDKPFATRKYDERDRIAEEEIFGAEKISYKYFDNGGFEKTTLTPNGLKSTETFDKLEKLVSAIYPDGGGLAAVSELAKTVLPDNSEKREALVKKLADDLTLLKDPIARANLMLQIGRSYIDDTLGPIDPHAAIKVYEAILVDPLADAYSKAQAHAWIASAYLDIGKLEWPNAAKHEEAILKLSSDNLDPERKRGLQQEQIAAFKLYLALLRTDRPETDRKLWDDMLIKYGSAKEFKEQVDALLSEQKRELSSRYFNN